MELSQLVHDQDSSFLPCRIFNSNKSKEQFSLPSIHNLHNNQYKLEPLSIVRYGVPSWSRQAQEFQQYPPKPSYVLRENYSDQYQSWSQQDPDPPANYEKTFPGQQQPSFPVYDQRREHNLLPRILEPLRFPSVDRQPPLSQSRNAAAFHNAIESSDGQSGLNGESNSNLLSASLKPCVCDICGKILSRRSTLQNHIRVVHFKQKNFNCHLCSKSFTQKYSLETHIRIHMKLKPYECENCNSKFTNKGDLTRHWKTVHLKLKPHKCDTCGSSFGLFNQLKKHIEYVHINVKQVKCPYCVRTFRKEDGLNNHIAACHPKAEVVSSDCS